jgi:hypothetical protein
VRLEHSADYFQERDIQHTMQGDIHRDVPFAHASTFTPDFNPSGKRTRPGESSAVVVPTATWLGIVCTYTCGFLAQPPGTAGYAHPFRLVAPIRTFGELKNDLTQQDFDNLLRRGALSGLMYLPYPIEDPEQADELRGHSVVCLYRASLVSQDLLDQRERLARLSVPAQRILIVRLIQVVSPYTFDPTDPALEDPDASDGWAPVE